MHENYKASPVAIFYFHRSTEQALPLQEHPNPPNSECQVDQLWKYIVENRTNKQLLMKFQLRSWVAQEGGEWELTFPLKWHILRYLPPLIKNILHAVKTKLYFTALSHSCTAMLLPSARCNFVLLTIFQCNFHCHIFCSVIICCQANSWLCYWINQHFKCWWQFWLG